MGLGASIKDLYYHLEDRYYEVLDKINSKVPVCKVTDQVDKVVPSFALLLLLIAILMIYLVMIFVLPMFAPQNAVLTVYVTDDAGNPLQGADIEIMFRGETTNYTTNADGTIEEFKAFVGSEIDRVMVHKEDYEIVIGGSAVLEDYKIETPEESINFELKEKITWDAYRFYIVDDTQQTVQSRVTLFFRCSNGDVDAPGNMSVNNGIAELQVSKKCGVLTADISAIGYNTLRGAQITDGSTIELMAEEKPEPEYTFGKVIANVKYDGERVTDQEIRVRLKEVINAEDMIEKDNERTSEGQAVFETVLPGKYRIVNDATSNLTSETSSLITVTAGDTETVTLNLEDRIIGQINIKVVDAHSNSSIEDAQVTLRKLGGVQVASGKTDHLGKLTFNLKEDIKYELIIDKEGYCLKTITSEKGDTVTEIELDRYTGPDSACGGGLVAKVKDELGNPVQNAVAMLFNEEGIYEGTERTTDVNGEATFQGISNGKYKIFAYKGYASNWSEVQEFIVRQGTEVEFPVTLIIPEGTIRVTVTDEDGEELFHNVLLTLRNATTDESLDGPRTIEREREETKEFSVIAGEPVYFYIYDKDGKFSSYLSAPIKVQPNEMKDANFVLKIKRISGEIKTEFLGLYKDDLKVSIVGAGEEYTAKFRLSMPNSTDYDEVGLHVRTGNKTKMEYDQVYIKKENVPGMPIVARGTSYSPDNGYSHDSQFFSANGSKWMAFTWDNKIYAKGLIYLDVTIKIKETATGEAALPIFWRGWGKDDSSMKRDPEDAALGTSETSNDLYAKTYKQTFQVGVETLCNDSWCYSTKILDIAEDLITNVGNSFSAKVGKDYKLDFSILNNSKSETDTFQDVQLRVRNPEETINFTTYKIEGKTIIEGNAGGASELPNVAIGDLGINQEVRGTVFFSPQSNLASIIQLMLHDPVRHMSVFEKIINIDIVAAEGFKLQFEKDGEFVDEPPMLPSGIENELKVKVLRARDSLEVKNADVKLKNKFGDTLQTTTSSTLGIAILKIPMLKPGEKLYVVAEKPDYEAISKEITVDETILTINPEKLGFSLNTVRDDPDKKTVKLENLTEMELLIEDVLLDGDFDGLIDEKKAQDWLNAQWKGKKIPAKGLIEEAVQVELSDFALLLEETKTAKGEIKFVVSAMGQKWIFPAGITISIGLGGELEDPDCLSISKKTWTDTIQEQSIGTDFMIINACRVDGKNVELKNISAQIDWKSNHVGNFEIKVDNFSKRLYGNYPKIIRGKMEKEMELPSSLLFTPDSGVVGSAEATITISGERATTSGKQVVSDSLDITLKIVNVRGCLTVDKDLITLLEGEEGTFTIEASDECGGEVQVELESKDLPLSIENFPVQQGSSKEITVKGTPNITGQYPVYIRAKFPGNREYQFIKLVRVLIEPEGCLRLNKYEYDITDCADRAYDGYDVGEVINVCHSKTVNAKVDFSEKDLWEAFKNAWYFGAAGFLWGGLNATTSGKTFWGTEKPITICANAGYELCEGKTVCEGDDIKMINNIICCATTCVSGEDGKSLREEICEKKGYEYCLGEACKGEKVPVKGIYCCKGQCQGEYEINALKDICRKGRLNYCEEDEICPVATEDYEGVICCPKKCVTQEKIPQMEICENAGMQFCYEKIGFYCPDGEITPTPQGVKCCNVNCIEETEKEEEIYTCTGGETCDAENTISIEGEITTCTEECNEPNEVVTERDEICEQLDKLYEHCEEGKICEQEEIEAVDVEGNPFNCCTAKCVDLDYTGNYKYQCETVDGYYCDSTAGEYCPEEEVLISEGDFAGLKCCTEECELGEPQDETENYDGFGAVITEKDQTCKNAGLGGNEFWDHCESGEACIAAQAKVVNGVNCCRHKCLNPEDEVQYQDFCSESGLTYCNFDNQSCSQETQIRLERPGKIGEGGLLCCEGTCVPLSVSNLKFYSDDCIQNTEALGTELYCSSGKRYVYRDYYNADCTTFPNSILTCNWYEECSNGACKIKSNLTTEQKDSFCSSFSGEDPVMEFYFSEPCSTTGGPEGMGIGIGDKKFFDDQPFFCCSRAKGTYPPTSGNVTQGTGGQVYTDADTKCEAANLGSYCPMGYDCKNMHCSRCGTFKSFPSKSAGEYCCSYGYTCLNPDGSPYSGGYQTAPTTTTSPTATVHPTTTATEAEPPTTGLSDEEKNAACQDSDYTGGTLLGPFCDQEFCTQCQEGGTCISGDAELITYEGESFYCCPFSYGCPNDAYTAPAQETGFMTGFALLDLGGILGTGGGILGGLNTAISSILGVDDPWTGMFMGWAAGTAYNYFYVQEEGLIDYVTTATDHNIDSARSFEQIGLEERDEPKIEVELGETTNRMHPDWPLGIEETEIVFQNKGIEQEEPFKPIFRGLEISGTEYDYNTEFTVTTKEDAESLARGEFLEIETEDGFKQKFHLQFNSYCEKTPEPDEWEPVNCLIGNMTGETGPDALPKIRFEWDWTNIKENTCDEDGEGIYCDATQFSISLLKKLNSIDTLLRGGSFACPSGQGVLNEKTQELSEIDKDIALTSIRVEKTGVNAKIVGTIESNNQTSMDVNAIINLTKNGTGTPIVCPEGAEKTAKLTSRSEVECTFNNLSNGVYTAEIEINPDLSSCESDCANEDTGNDHLTTNLVVGDSGAFEKCDPYTTERLADYAAANPGNSNLKKAYELANFKANLIMDGYSNDFREDFHDFSLTKGFFNTPSYYTGDSGLWKYFTNNELMEFDSSFLRPESGKLESGKYQVRIFIEYNDDTWSLFKANEPNATIKVKLDWLTTPEPDSPFYYMPFNGQVGIDSENGRVGYGINYRQETQDPIKINEDTQQLVITSEIAPGTSIPGGWLYTSEIDNFKSLNRDNRGVVLEATRTTSESTIAFSPSQATPVLLRVLGGESDRAWAFYSLEVNGEPQMIGSSLATWEGYVRGCRDFSDRELVENYMHRSDIHGGTTNVTACGPVQQSTSYGLEWCDVTRKGTVYLSTMFFTPQGAESVLELKDSHDSASFIAPGASGHRILLKGVLTERIESVEKIFELVRKEDICVAGKGNSAGVKFFWNPKMVIEKSLASEMSAAKGECILPA